MKQVPKKQIVVPSKDKKFLNKLLLLHNNLMQYHVIPYDEVLIKFEHTLQAGEVIPSSAMLIYFEPTDIKQLRRHKDTDAYQIYNILSNYIKTGLITKNDMVLANSIWNKLREKAR